jgi:hypothetical protein
VNVKDADTTITVCKSVPSTDREEQEEYLGADPFPGRPLEAEKAVAAVDCRHTARRQVLNRMYWL